MSKKSGRPLPRTPRDYNENDNAKKMVVRKLPRGVSVDTLELYFESKKHHERAMVVKNVDLDIANDEAIITFDSASDVEYVLKRQRSHPCTLNKQTLVVEPLEETADDTVDACASQRGSQNYSDMYEYSSARRDDETDTIEVRKFSKDCSEDTLQFYFENKRRSGGGEIVSFSMQRDKGYAHITFKEMSVAKRVLEQKHVVEHCELTVVPFIISKTELLLDEVPDTVTEENISNFVEAKLKVQVVSAVFSQDGCKCLVQCSERFDFSKAKEVCKKFKVGGVHVIPSQIPVSTGVIVTNIPEDITHDGVEVYFENTRRSQGGETQNVEIKAEDGYCLVFFKDANVVGRVCQKKDHKLHGRHVDVKPYNEYLGLPLGQESLAFRLPEPLSLKDEDPHKIKFLKTNDSQRSTLERELAKCKAQIFWDDDPVSIECTFTKDDKPKRQILQSWSETALQRVKHFTDVLVVNKKVVDMGIWSEIRRELGGLHLTHPDGVALITEKENEQIILVAHKAMADSVWQDVVGAIATAEKKEKEKKETTTEERELTEWKIAYLKGADFANDMHDTHKNVKLRFEERKGKGKLFVTGPKQIVANVWIAMYESIENVKQREIELDKEEIELLQNEATIEKVKQKMKNKRVSDVWEIKRGCVVLYADEDDDLSKMENAISKTLAKLTIPLDSGKESVLKSEKWKATKKSLRDKFSGCVVISVHDSQLDIFTLADIQDKVSDELQSFLDKNASYKEQMSLTPHVVSFFQHVIKTKYDQEIQALRNKGLNIKMSLNEKSGAVSLEGTSDGINEAKRVIKRLQDKIEIKQHTIKHPKVKKYIDCSHGKECVKKVQNNTPCVIDMQGSGFKRSIHNRQSSTMAKFDKPTNCAEAVLKSGVKILVVGGDITELQVDVLVNAANSEMKHAGGLAAVIVNKGGRAIQTECDDRIRKKGSLSEGDVFMSGSGNLNCKFVAHAVGPHWRGGGNEEEMCLQKAVFACIEKTEKRNLKSIAMPALSAGMFQYPVNMSCMGIVKAIDQHFQGTRSSIKEVYLCDISQGTVNAFTNALQVVIPNTKVQVDLSQGDGPKPKWIIHNDDDNAGKQSGSGGNITIEVVKGELAKERVDVIVNSTSPDLQLQRGALSNALLKAGGSKIQQECNQKYQDGIEVGDVAVTTAGKLKCSKIYHITMKHFDHRNPRVCLKGLNECVTACLQDADQNGCKSISFPAMGTGAQKYPKDKVAKEMFKAVSTFGSKNSSTAIRNVRFVIYTEDDETFEEFVTEEKNWKGGNSHQSRPSTGRKHLKSGVGKLVKESRGHAEFQIGNLKVEIHGGDITEDSSEAIVASCNMELDLSKGAVTKAILKKGGDAIEQDCQQQKSTMKKEGIAITTAGQLKAKYIIHVDTKYKTWEWPPVVLACLRKAEKHKISSVAFPALGTSVGCKPEDIAEVMCSAMGDFHQDNPKHLQKIGLIIFQKDMLTDFITGMKRSVTGRPQSGERSSGDRQQAHSRHSRHQHHKQFRQEEAHDTSEDSCTITIYAEGKDKIDRAIKSFEQTVEKEWIVKKLEDQGIHRLNFNHIKEVKAMARNNHVDVTVDTDLGNIVVIGLVANVLEVFDAIHSQLRSADKSFYMKDQAKLMSNIVKWIYLKDQKEIAFPDRINLEIETAYKQKQKQVKVKDRSGGEYEIDFGNMTEHDVKQPNTKFPVIRRDLVAGASFDIPKNWQAMKDKENLKLVTLNQADSEYSKVVSEFKSTLGRQPNIVKIERIQNKTLYTQYAAKRKEMNVNNPNKKDNEKMLWHGTADYAVQSINSHGFNRSYCGKNATAIGQGVYFAVNANYSDQGTYTPPGSDGNKRMYRCLVLTGKYCNGTSDMRVPPAIDKSKPHILYDSVTNNTGSPAMYVVFNDTQAYPEHLITYR
ncbi:protein mono-ADP-ribosyltransferase PARP14-like [Mercenaria mercenaria]|uniref:protein mono-ADP-ribosyltransferase PARP14-like n=1 Tax=Mercenaria mercenaria TaxID=6596 RepID=UPI00234E9ADA|nr:protein mono-ADP-ribosyltransferase PARP14-like [Mercenaria mercenaria]